MKYVLQKAGFLCYPKWGAQIPVFGTTRPREEEDETVFKIWEDADQSSHLEDVQKTKEVFQNRSPHREFRIIIVGVEQSEEG